MKKKAKNLNFSQIGANITLLMEHCEIDATGLSKETGLPTSTISRLRSNITDFSPNISSLIPIARYFQITVSQLIGEELLPPDICGEFKPVTIKKQLIPVLNVEMLDRQQAQQALTDAFMEIDLALSEKAFAYIVQGNAMEPQFDDKDLLIVDPEPIAANLDFVLVTLKEKKSPLLRQILIDGDDRYLRALNPLFNEIIKLDPLEHKILGVIIQARKNFKNKWHNFLYQAQ